jgi:hypothetical protein
VLHLHVQKLDVDGEWLVELRDGDRPIYDSLGGPCIAAGCKTRADAVGVFLDSWGAADCDVDGDSFSVFADALLRGVESDEQLEARLDVVASEFG